MKRNITPSDIDASVDNNGTILMMELNSRTAAWTELPYGQRKHYESYVKAGNGKISAALLQHKIPEGGKQIDTIEDVISWSWMTWSEGTLKIAGPFPGNKWVPFLNWWWAEGERL